MNDLQRLSAEKHGNLFATLNPLSPPSQKHLLGRYAYSHPVLSADAVRAQRRLAQLNSRATDSGRHRAFAGAWTRYGFHEDGFAAGLRAAAALPGVALPFAIVDADVERGEPCAGTIAYVFDMLEALRALVVVVVARVLRVMITTNNRHVAKKVD
jgi:predicted NAD/FAD-binding protein